MLPIVNWDTPESSIYVWCETFSIGASIISEVLGFRNPWRLSSESEMLMEMGNDLEAIKKKSRSRDKFLVRKWNGIKRLLGTVAPYLIISKVSREDAKEFSLLSGLDTENCDFSRIGGDGASS
ncbi:hypothetical protein HAX54_011910 [Datura stramonium]|uniref:Uncharacterized protein n=1 Tax=Datura stramonium TaxID=4076 RepID=A0ABS8TJT8_DATST|nr:hypothetical protein [Datura stramonium]